MDTYNKNAAEVIKFLHDPEDDVKCVQNLVNESTLVSISIAPITKEIQVFHHMTKIGGTLTIPDDFLLALQGFSSKAIPVQFDNEIFGASFPSLTTFEDS